MPGSVGSFDLAGVNPFHVTVPYGSGHRKGDQKDHVVGFVTLIAEKCGLFQIAVVSTLEEGFILFFKLITVVYRGS